MNVPTLCHDTGQQIVEYFKLSQMRTPRSPKDATTSFKFRELKVFQMEPLER